MRYALIILLLVSANLAISQRTLIIDHFRNYDLDLVDSLAGQYDDFTTRMLNFQSNFLRHYKAFELKFDTAQMYNSKTDPLGQFYFHVNKGDYLFYAFDSAKIHARRAYIEAITLAKSLNRKELVCEGIKKMLNFYALSYLNARFVNPSIHLEEYDKHTYDDFEKANLDFYRLLFGYRNSPMVGNWSNERAQNLLDYVNSSNHYFFNAKVHNLIANYTYNVLEKYDSAMFHNLSALRNLESIKLSEYRYSSTLQKQIYTGITRHSVKENFLVRADSFLNQIDTVSRNKVETYYLRYYYYYKSSIDTFRADFASAYENYRKYTVLSETADIYNNADAVRLLEAEYEDKQRLKIIEAKERQLTIIKAMVFVLVSLSIALLLAFSNIRKKKFKIETLIRELHHRVKNNLQVISSLLGLQAMRLEDASAKTAVFESKDRIKAMSLIHQKLYQTEEIASLNIQEYLNNLVYELSNAYANKDNIEINIDVPAKSFHPDISLPLGLIVNEVVSNAFKYAYEGIEQPSLELKLYPTEDDRYCLTIQDNGKGLDPDFDLQTAQSFGMKLINLLSKQLGATLMVENKKGLCYRLIFAV